MSVGTIAIGLLVLLAAALLLVLFSLIRYAPRSAAAGALGQGEFSTALESADTGPGAEREDLLAAAVAAKHLLLFDRAAETLDRALEQDPEDGEVWLERGLVAAYAGEHDRAAAAFGRAESLRSDLAEPLALHRSWLALRRGNEPESRRLFEEIEAPIESKLLVDVGPGDPLFSEWFLQGAELWLAHGRPERAAWARREGLRSAPESRLGEILAPPSLE